MYGYARYSRSSDRARRVCVYNNREYSQGYVQGAVARDIGGLALRDRQIRW